MLAHIRKRLWQGVVAALFTALLVTIPQPAAAAESIPALQWPAVQVSNHGFDVITSPSGEVTTSCASADNPVSNLRTYDGTGQLVREIIKTDTIDDVENCIEWPAVGEDGDVYGIPTGQRTNGSYGPGPNLLAYSGNTLKWKYPTGCNRGTFPTIGVDGNIYFVGNGRLIGLTPDVQPPSTGPAKVLDIPAGINGCADDLVAFKDGIAVVKDLHVKFFSYNGINLGGPLGNAYKGFTVDQISANGRFFYDTYLTSGGLRSAQISAYDYGRQEVMWTTTVSDQGAYIYSAYPYATPDGGTLVYLRLKETNALGEWTGRQAYGLVKLNAFGIKEWSKTLPLSDTNGNTYGEADIKIDTNGNIAVIRSAKLKTSKNRLADAVTITVFNDDGSTLYADTLHGNLDESVAYFTGYRLDNDLGIAPDTLYVTAQQCSGTYCESGTKLFPIEVPGLGLDYPRGTVYDEAPRPASSYIALGDSFSSGEGVEPFEASTDIPNLNKCHRSENAYPRLLVDEHGAPSLGSDGFRACSGAVTTNITDAAQWNEGIQLDLWLDPTTELVTVTIGGNDIGFGPTIETCALEPWNCDSAFQDANLKVANLGDVLADTYTEILEKTPNAQVYVIGYAPLFTAGAGCTLGPNSDYPITESRKQQAIDLLNALNTKISDSVEEVRATSQDYFNRLSFVSATDSNSPFNGHEICSEEPYFHGLDLAHDSYSFHPNTSGQQAYAELVAGAINAG